MYYHYVVKQHNWMIQELDAYCMVSRIPNSESQILNYIEFWPFSFVVYTQKICENSEFRYYQNKTGWTVNDAVFQTCFNGSMHPKTTWLAVHPVRNHLQKNFFLKNLTWFRHPTPFVFEGKVECWCEKCGIFCAIFLFVESFDFFSIFQTD